MNSLIRLASDSGEPHACDGLAQPPPASASSRSTSTFFSISLTYRNLGAAHSGSLPCDSSIQQRFSWPSLRRGISRRTLFSPTRGRPKRFLSKTCKVATQRGKRGTGRFKAVAELLHRLDLSTSGLTLAVSTNRVVQNSPKQLIPCTLGIRRPTSATFTYQTIHLMHLMDMETTYL